MRRATCVRPPRKRGRRRNIIRGHWRRTLAVLVPIAIGLLVAAGIGTARESGHAQGADKPKPRHSNDPPKAIKHDESPPLRSLNSKPPKGRNDHQERKIPVPPGSNGPDPVQQSSLVETSSPTAGTNFDGVSAVDSLPPDPNGAVGPDDYVQIVNESFAVYSKSGTKLYGPVTTNTLFTGFGGDCEDYNDGDATVVYDRAADRWVISQFAVSGSSYLQCVAVSKTSDPTGEYWRYSFEYNDFPDYPKLGVWPDAYYITFNLFSFDFIGPEVCAYDRARMLSGLSATQQCFILDAQYGGMLPSDLDSSTPPPTGAPNYLLNFDTNSLDLWKFHVDWATPTNTTLNGPTVIPVASFSPACGGGACIKQPKVNGRVTNLDSLGDRLMYRLAYRNFGDHESFVVNHAITANVSGNSTVGVRWYELRTTPASATGTPAVFQQGTFAPDKKFRWMGSIAMSGGGDIGLGYSRSSSANGDYPSVAYTGRLAGDAPGVMTQGETVLKSGAGSQTDYDRWGDYSSMSVDPSDDCTFWYTNEYLPNTDSFNWKTRIGSFRLPGCGSSGGGGGGAVTNGDFEMGSFAPWSASGDPKPKLVSSPVHGGSKAALIGSTSGKKGDSKLSETVTVPSGSPHLTFFYLPTCKGSFDKDQQKMQINTTGGSTLATVLNACENLSSWQSVDVDMSTYAGQTVVLLFKNHDDGKSGKQTYFVVDDVALR